MCARKKQESAGISILDAVETLADIADLEFEKEISQSQENEINEHNQEVTSTAVKTLHLKKEDPDTTVAGIRDTFKTVLDYLRNFYERDYSHMDRERAMEGVKTIMVIVGEAAKKLDKYTTLFKRTKEKSVTELKEYKQLQNFYLTRIARKVDESVLGKWIFELTKGAMARREAERMGRREPTTTKRVFIDLDSVKNDTEYELFFIKKEDGTRFYNLRLIRNIKLVCDFGGRIGREEEIDPFDDIQEWQDKVIQESAKNLIQSLGANLDRYYHEARDYSKRKIVNSTNKALMALLLSSNPKNLLTNVPVKSCLEYFVDFQGFLRRVLESREYQRWIAYPPRKTNRFAHCMLDIIHSLCHALMVRIHGYQELMPTIEKIVEEAEGMIPEVESETIWEKLATNFQAITQLIKRHPNGPLVKDLEILERGGYYAFDPIMQFNIPFQLYSFYVQENKITNVRIPSPVHQESIHRAVIIEEFKGFLRSIKDKQKHLIINLQDRTSWKEHVRCIALEELQHQKEFKKTLTVVTIAKDTDFYEQSAPYDEDNKADIFITHFKEHLKEETCGFYFPDKIKNVLFPKFVDGVIESIHRVFFSDMNVLTVENRRDFIELFYLFLQLKLIELVEPDTFSLSCKDAIDVGGIASTQLYAFLKSFNGFKLSDEELHHLDLILYTAPLLVRERIPLANRFERMVSVLKRVELTREEYGHKNFDMIINEAFGRHYDTPILQSVVVPPK